MQEKLNIAVYVDYDNIEIGVKSTLRREFDVALALDALKERGDPVAKFAYANWSRQEGATRSMAENAVQMVQRVPSPRGDKNGGDINLALDALEMAFTHRHVNAFAIVSGDSDFIPLVNKLKQYGKMVLVVGGKQFTSTILQQNCHEFISYESLLDTPKGRAIQHAQDVQQQPRPERIERLPGERLAKDLQQPKQDQPRQEQPRQEQPRQEQPRRDRPAPLDLALSMPLVERALDVLERRGVQPQLGLLKSTMLQLDSSFSERAYGCGSFSDFVEKLKKADYVNVSGQGGRYIIERKSGGGPTVKLPEPEEALPGLRDVLETHRLEMENGVPADHLAGWAGEELPDFNAARFGFQQFTEFLVYAQDKGVVRVEPDEERGLMVYLGAEFYPPAAPSSPEPVRPAQQQRLVQEEDEDDGPQPYVEGQPTIFEPNPPPAKATKKAVKKRAPRGPSGRKNAQAALDNLGPMAPKAAPVKRTPRKKKSD